ncbi:unnamed protein product [Pieris brassicae]|uniref:Reverse transcriptase domain-containing protein n=1 Tax=Pieris brassicae TaxID=7116 RepID=A0A9P0TQC7_PIEBR|nr:unnamed protein product [Pieris brassicae]
MHFESVKILLDSSEMSTASARPGPDFVLITDNLGTLQIIIKELETLSKEVGATINKSKTKAMTNRTPNTIILENKNVEYVTTYIYLGQLISMSEQPQQEIERRTSNAWRILVTKPSRRTTRN